MNWTRVLLVALAALGLVVEEVASLSLDPGRCSTVARHAAVAVAVAAVFTVVFMCKHAIATGQIFDGHSWHRPKSTQTAIYVNQKWKKREKK